MLARVRGRPGPAPGRLYLAVWAVDGVVGSLIFTLNLVYQATVVGLTPLELVLVGTVLEITTLVAEVPTGAFADLRGRRPAVVAGYLLLGAGFVLEGGVPAFWAVLLSQVVWGTGAAFISGAFDAWLVDATSPEIAAPLFLRGAQLDAVGGIFGIGASVALGWTTPRIPIVVGGLAWIGVGVVLWLVMVEHRTTTPGDVVASPVRALGAQAAAGVRLVRRSRLLLGLTAVALVSGLSSEAFDRLWTPQLLHVGLPSVGGLRPVAWFGIVALVATVVDVAVIEVVRRRFEHRGERALALGTTLLCAGQVAAMAVFALAVSPLVALVSYWTARAASRTQDPLIAGWLNRHLPSEARATLLSFQSQANALGQIVGGPICGVVASTAGLSAGLGLSALLLAPAVVLLAALTRGLARPAPASLDSFVSEY
jgi:MFS transporter, DHA3 family, tetracycline resistance protein